MTAKDPVLDVQGGLEGYAALAAHQLGEAVALVRGASSVLDGQRDRLGPGGEDALRAMAAGTERAQRFVDDLLDLVRATNDVVEPATSDLAAAFAAAQAELEVPLRRSGARITHRDLDTAPAPLSRGDAERLFVHLVRSALAADAHRLHVVAERDGPVLVLEMADDGDAPRANADPLEPFGRPRGRGPLVGAGFSLLICRRLAERHGGSVALTRSDDGVVVSIRLPLDG
jgi:signal transduction histidine kinase